MPMRYHINLPDAASARGDEPTLAFASQGAEGLAAELQDALRSDALFQRWRALQDDPDEVDPALGATDPEATVHGSQHDLHVELVVVTSLPSSIMRQRLGCWRGMAGSCGTCARPEPPPAAVSRAGRPRGGPGGSR